MSSAARKIEKEAPTCETVLITPDMAREWLKLNTKNRPVKQSLVKKYARSISQGTWELNGESIKFNTDGELIDGQHRLQAIFVADSAARMFVMKGLLPETFHTLDTGRQRDTADVLHIKGELNIYVLSSALRLLFLYNKFEGDWSKGMGFKGGISVIELESTLVENPEIRRSVSKISLLVQNKILQPSVASVTYYLLHKAHASKADEFFTKLVIGNDLSKGDPVLLLRNILLNSIRSRAYVSQTNRLAIVIKAWNAFLAEEKIDELTYSHNEEFPKIARKKR